MKHLIIGPPCAGKTTYALKHKLAGDVLIDFDRLCLALGALREHDAPDSVKKMAGLVRAVLLAKIDSGKTDIEAAVWATRTRPSDVELEKFLELGWRVHVLDPGIGVCLERADREKRPHDTAKAIEAWYADPPKLGDGSKRGPKVMKTKTCKAIQARLKTDTDGLGPGQFEGYASVFDVIDSIGDKVVKGAFAESLKSFGKDGAGIPCYWQHNTADPEFNIGHTIAAFEDDHGLKVRVQLDLDNPKAAYVHKLIKEGRVRQMSFAYEVEEGEKAGEAFLIQKCKLFEVSVVPVGCNQETELLAVKAAKKEKEEEEMDKPVEEPEEEKDAAEILDQIIDLCAELKEKLDLAPVQDSPKPSRDEESEDEQEKTASVFPDPTEPKSLVAKALDAILNL